MPDINIPIDIPNVVLEKSFYDVINALTLCAHAV